ncbi:hypothetical protein K432DRAFT_442577 [Lepidopterella palustris CBS 459.81]|uniref:Uncharacterized protein n=1 Tax=Lepidopterella palustris CBS 459.81 TaxID=1314670 RepID=A0A8E2EBW4_9PEZI|nr:hypothetical protein K432DRAFT_442577 [Lepidopterella palustris CBS 459.81]
MPSRAAAPARCNHAVLRFSPSAHAAEAGFSGPTARQRATAATASAEATTKASGKRKRDVESNAKAEAYPAPLILPGDDLALDPTYPTQSFWQWLRMKPGERNEVTSKRRTIYVAGPPDITDEVAFMRTWNTPSPSSKGKTKKDLAVPPPQMPDVVNYVEAFYHGLPVKIFPASDLSFTAWESQRSMASKTGVRSTKTPSIGLRTSKEVVRIRTRPSRDHVYKAQLNLDDLLDGAIAMLPKDAYALLLLVEQDLFEDEEDEFVCGLAYGGSRVAVVSMARYHPNLDEQQNVEREHAWPASHCDEYVRACCEAENGADSSSPAKRKKTKMSKDPFSTASLFEADSVTGLALGAAVSVHAALPTLSLSISAAALSGLWLGRVCRTASHELGHCFGIDHCVYYACNMQGSASIVEDARQAPYLCPVDSAKVEKATGASAEERNRALVRFCDDHKDVHLFAALGAWLRGFLEGDED